jgi:hypothetical protein
MKKIAFAQHCKKRTATSRIKDQRLQGTLACRSTYQQTVGKSVGHCVSSLIA